MLRYSLSGDPALPACPIPAPRGGGGRGGYATLSAGSMHRFDPTKVRTGFRGMIHVSGAQPDPSILIVVFNSAMVCQIRYVSVFRLGIYQRMISNKKNGLSVSLMATRVMPSLLPQTMNPSLSLEQFTNLLEVLQEMLELIDRFLQMADDVISIFFVRQSWNRWSFYWFLEASPPGFKLCCELPPSPVDGSRSLSLSLYIYLYLSLYLLIWLIPLDFFWFLSISLDFSLGICYFYVFYDWQFWRFVIRHQRNKLKLDNLSLASPERLRALRHQHSTDNMHAPNFNIPFVKVEQRKTCSEENMIKTHSSSNLLRYHYLTC